MTTKNEVKVYFPDCARILMIAGYHIKDFQAQDESDGKGSYISFWYHFHPVPNVSELQRWKKLGRLARVHRIMTRGPL